MTPDVAAVMDHLEPLWESMTAEAVSCDTQFQVYYQLAPRSPLSSDQIREILGRYQLADHPEAVAEFTQEITGTTHSSVVPVHHLIEQGEWRRRDIGTISYVDVADYSFTIESNNKQIHVYEPGRAPTTVESLSIFRSPMKSRAEGHIPTRVQREGQLVRLETDHATSHHRGTITIKSTIDWATGVPISRSHYLDSTLIQETLYSALTTFASGLTFPRCSATIRYEQDRVASIDLALMRDSVFNEPIPEQAFLVSKPQGWKVLDFRNDSPGTEIKVPSEPASDVRTLIPETTTQLHSVAATQLQPIKSMSIPLRAVLILNGTALIALGVWMWRQASLSGQKH